jgi:hypothetical protein
LRRFAEVQVPLCTPQPVRQSRARAGRDTSLRRSASPASLRCSRPWPRRLTLYARFARCARTDAPSQRWWRAARAGHERCACRRLGGAPRPARARLCGGAVLWGRKPTSMPRVGRCPAGATSAATRSAHSGSARDQRASWSDLPHLFERSAQARSELCGTTPGRAPQCSRTEGPTAAA